MRNFVSFEIEGATPVDYRYLYDEGMEYALKENESFKHSNIYFFCKVHKRRFDLSKTRISNTKDLHTVIRVNGVCYEIQESIYNLIFIFQNQPSSIQESFNIEIDSDSCTETHLIFNLSSELIDNESFQVRLSVIDLEHSLNIDLKNYPEVIYIGQSFRILDRIREHKTLNKATSRLIDNEELIIYFINFRYGIGDKYKVPSKMWDFMLENENRMSKEYREKISLAERFLIYLFKPIYNDQHVNTELSKDMLVKNILLSSGISMIAMCYEMHGNLFRFWSPNQRLKAELVFYDFDNPHMEFYENADIL